MRIKHNFNIGDPVIGNDGMGDIFGYYLETISDKKNVWIRFTPKKNKKNCAVYIRSIKHIRPATTIEISKYEKRK